jgi:hypothetical protein
VTHDPDCPCRYDQLKRKLQSLRIALGTATKALEYQTRPSELEDAIADARTLADALCNVG